MRVRFLLMRCSKLIICVFALIAALSGFSVGQEPPEIVEVIISGEGVKNPDQLRRILPFREGNPYEIETIAKGASILKKTGLFSSVLIRDEYTEGGVRVIVELVPLRFIRKIKFKKSFPLFESALRRAVRVREGDPFIPDEIEKDVKRLESYLQNQGYFKNDVVASSEVDPGSGDIILKFTIHKGFTYNLLAARVEGNKVLTDGRIRLAIRRRMPLRYRREKLDLGLETLLKLYHRRGYYEARVKLESIDLDPVLRTVVVNLKIHEGPRAKVIIKGDKHVWERKLRKQLTLVEEESIDEFDIETSALMMKELYLKQGYRNVEVDWKIERKETGDDILNVITFDIAPGRRVVISRIIFRGRDKYRTKRLKKQMLTGRSMSLWKKPALYDKVLEEDMRALRAFYRSKGYLDAQITGPELEFNKKKDRVRVIVNIKEGPQTVVGEVTFKGMEHFESSWALGVLSLVPGEPFNENLLEKDKEELLIHYANSGFPYARVSVKVEPMEADIGKAVAIRYSIVEDIRVRVGELVLRGNYRTRARVLSREIEMIPGDAFSYEGLLDSRGNLRKLAFLSAVRLDTLGLEERLDVAHLLLRVQEYPSRTVDFGFGWDSENGPLLSAAVGDLNLFGLGKTGEISARGGGDINEMEVSYADPRFMGFRVRADMTGSGSLIQREAFDLTQAAARFALTRQVIKTLALTAGIRAEWNHLSNVVDQAAVDDFEVNENTLMAAGPQIIFDTRNDFIRPSKGVLATTRVEYGREFLNSDNWVKFFVQGATYYNVFDNVVLAVSARYGHIEPMGNSLIPIQEAFFVGGIRSVRGYSEDGLGPRATNGDPLGGLDMVVTNTEVRFPIYSIFGGVFFVDSGQLVTGGQKLSLQGQMFTVGTGLRISTPVGPIGIDYGYKLEPSEFERRWRLHFTFGYPF